MVYVAIRVNLKTQAVGRTFGDALALCTINPGDEIEVTLVGGERSSITPEQALIAAQCCSLWAGLDGKATLDGYGVELLKRCLLCGI